MNKLLGVILALVCLSACGVDTQAQQPPQMDYAGFEARVEQTGDTLMIYNFWATWCKPCVEELPHFAKLQETYADQPVKVVLVSLDFANLNEKLIPFLAEKGIALPVWHLTDLDYNTWIVKVSEQWDGAIPATWVSVQSSKKSWFHGGDFTEDELNQWIEEILTEI